MPGPGLSSQAERTSECRFTRLPNLRVDDVVVEVDGHREDERRTDGIGDRIDRAVGDRRDAEEEQEVEEEKV